MKIVCTPGVLYAEEAFSSLGDVLIVPEQDLAREHLLEADALVVRSKTNVGEALLTGTPVRFVGSATSGDDHLDLEFFSGAGITVSVAYGCNASSVAQYVAAALLHLATRHGVPLEGKRLGIIGAGHCGSAVAASARALGLEVLLCDPPLRDATGEADYRDLDDVLAASNILTLHVPLSDQAPYATRRMVNAGFFSRCKPGVFMINASRGEVVDEEALVDALKNGSVRGAVLDVWDHEPDTNVDLAKQVDLATPHIAGHSWEGRTRGTVMVYEALCNLLGTNPTWQPPGGEETVLLELSSGPPPSSVEEEIGLLVAQVYDVTEDDRAFRSTFSLPTEERGQAFLSLRRTYRRRPEFSAARTPLEGLDEKVAAALSALGMKPVQPAAETRGAS